MISTRKHSENHIILLQIDISLQVREIEQGDLSQCLKGFTMVYILFGVHFNTITQMEVCFRGNYGVDLGERKYILINEIGDVIRNGSISGLITIHSYFIITILITINSQHAYILYLSFLLHYNIHLNY